MQTSVHGSWAASLNEAASNCPQSWATLTHCRQKWTILPTDDLYPGLCPQVHTWCVAVQLFCNSSSHISSDFYTSEESHTWQFCSGGGRTRQDLMTVQKKLANNGHWASLWEESEMLLLLSIGQSFVAQHAKLPVLCQNQMQIAQQELNWLTLLIPFVTLINCCVIALWLYSRE